MNLHFNLGPCVEININSDFHEVEVIRNSKEGFEIKMKPDAQTGDLHRLLEERRTGIATFEENETEREKKIPIRIQSIKKLGQRMLLQCEYCQAVNPAMQMI